jgi:hypothetical protein
MRNSMKKAQIILLSFSVLLLASSCGVFSKKGSGCPSNGKNVGAEKVMEMSEKELKKQPKFKA